MKASYILPFFLSLAYTADVYQGFNSGAFNAQNVAKQQSDFESEFKTAQGLQNSPGAFNSVRLYTNIQAGTISDPSSAFPAAIATNTKMLLGAWASGTNNITNELNALSSAISKYGTDFVNLVIGISVGSEDLYRVSESGVKNKAGVGQEADTMLKFIQDMRDAVADTSLSKVPIGHVDSWSAWVNTSNADVIDAVDFVGVDIYPYYEDDQDNSFANAGAIFNDLLNKTKTAAGDKPVYITETGWPVSGPDFGNAKPSVQNALGYWDSIGCSLFGRMNVWWFTLEDDNTGAAAQFGVTEDNSLSPTYNLTCPAGSGAPATININTNANSNSGSHFALPQVWSTALFLLAGAACLF